MSIADQIAELEQWIADIEFKLSISPDHPVRSQLPGARMELEQLRSKLNHPAARTLQFDAVLDGTVSVTEAAKQLGVTGQSVRNWIRAGKLTATRHGNEFRVDRVSVGQLAEMRRETRVINPAEVR